MSRAGHIWRGPEEAAAGGCGSGFGERSEQCSEEGQGSCSNVVHSCLRSAPWEATCSWTTYETPGNFGDGLGGSAIDRNLEQLVSGRLPGVWMLWPPGPSLGPAPLASHSRPLPLCFLGHECCWSEAALTWRWPRREERRTEPGSDVSCHLLGYTQLRHPAHPHGQ